MWDKILKSRKTQIIIGVILLIVSIASLFNGLYALIKIAGIESREILFNLAKAPLWLIVAYKLLTSKYEFNLSNLFECKWFNILFLLIAVELSLNLILKI